MKTRRPKPQSPLLNGVLVMTFDDAHISPLGLPLHLGRDLRLCVGHLDAQLLRPADDVDALS